MNEIDELEDILDALMKGVQELIQSGEPFPEDLQNLVAQEINTLTSEIDQIYASQQEQQTQPPQREPFAGGEVETLHETAPSGEIQLLWILAGQNEQAFSNYVQQYGSPETQALLRNPAELERQIEFLSAMMPSGEQPIVDGIQHADLNSSTIWGTKYDPQTGKMQVRFQGGSEYEYEGVPPKIYQAFSQGNASAKTKGQNQYGKWWISKFPSLGAAMNQYIKAGNFPYRKLS